MQDDQDNGEFPVSDNPESNQTSYDDEADARHRRARRTPLLPLARVQPLARMPRQHHRQMMTTSPYATFSCGAAFPCLSCC